MAFKYLMILLSLQIIFTVVLCSRKVVNGSLSRNESVTLDRKSKFRKKQAIFSIQSEDGDIIDCIDIYKQPSFDHPALKHHKIQMSPSQKHYTEMQVEAETTKSSPSTVTKQVWHKSGSCPKGTIPVRRTNKKHPNYERRKPAFLHQQNRRYNDSNRLNFLRQNYSLGILHTEGYAYIGAKGDIKVCYPNVELDDEYSTSRVALKSGSNKDYEAMETGWQVNPREYGDRQTRLFTYWTIDASQKTGCFDLTCPGFIQTSSEIALGAAIYPISDPNGLPYQIVVFIYKDPVTDNWWVQYGEEINVGYWPPDIFVRQRIHAETVQWGGEVHSSRVGIHPGHTATAMGSGKFPDFMMQSSGYVKRMRVLIGNVLKFPDWVYPYADEYRCYDVYYLHDYIPDPEFYYGGPGRYYLCT